MSPAEMIKRFKLWVYNSIHRRLIVWSISFWVISLIIISLIVGWTGQSRTIQETSQRNTQLASIISRDMSSQINSISNDARTFSRHLLALGPDISAQAEAVWSLRLASPQRYRAIHYFDSNGDLLFDLTGSLEEIIAIKNATEIITRPKTIPGEKVISAFTQAKSGFNITDMLFTEIERIPVVYLGLPLKFSSGSDRVVVLEIDLTDIWQTIDLFSLGRSGFAYIVSKDGLIIAHPNTAYLGNRVAPELVPLLTGHEGFVEYLEPTYNQTVMSAFSPVGGQIGWGIVIQQDRSEIYDMIIRTNLINIIIWLILAVVGTLGILWMIRRFTKPIIQLTQTARNIAETGDLSRTVILQNPDEVGQMGQAFSLMIERIKAAETNLVNSEERYRSLFEHANDAILLIDKNEIIDCNRKAEEIFGISRDQIIHKSPSDFSPQNQPDGSDSREKEKRLISRTFAGEEQLFEWRHQKLNGESFDAEVCLNRLNIGSKQILMAIIRDITEKRKAAERLQESEQLFRSIVENSQAGIFTVDNAFLFTYVNDRLCQILGYSRDEIIGQDFRNFLSEESKKLVADRYIRRQKGRELPSWYEFIIIQKSGASRNVELSAAVVRDVRGDATTVGQILDITERKRSQIELQQARDELENRVEQRTSDLRQANELLNQEITQRKRTEEKLRRSEVKYRDLVESANSIILEFDLNGNITFFNRFAQEFFGYKEGEILGRNILGTIVPEIDSNGDDLRVRMGDLLKHPERYSNSENENMLRDGERVWITWTNKEIYTAQGSLSHILSIGIDRTERRKTAEILAKQERENVATTERTRLARDLHDAVSQTLFSATLIAEVLPRVWERSKEEGLKRLEELRQLTRGALAEMRTLLFELRPAALAEAELTELLRHLADSVTGRARLPVTLEISGGCTMTPEIKVALYRIAQEALNNVAKHSGASQAKIALKCQGKGVVMKITDDGQGFDIAKTRAGSLGLNIMQERAKGIGASLNIYSGIDKGTEVLVVWPSAKEES